MRGRRPSAVGELVDRRAHLRVALVALVRARRTRRRCYGSSARCRREHLFHARRRSRRRSPARGWPRSTARAGCRRRARPRAARRARPGTPLRRGSRAASASRASCCSRTLGVVDVADVDVAFLGEPVLVDADDHLLAAVDRGLPARRRFLDAQLRHARLDRLGHAAERLDLFDQLPRLVGEARGERLDVVAAAERVDHLGDAGLLGEDQLRVAGDAGGELARQRDRLVERVGVQALRAAEHRGERLDRGAHDVVVRVLLGERHARRLAVRAQHRASPASAGRTGRSRAPTAGARRAASRPP